MALLNQVGVASVRSLQYLAPKSYPSGSWELRNIRRLWLVTRGDGLPLQLVLEDEAGQAFTHYDEEVATGPRLQFWPVLEPD